MHGTVRHHAAIAAAAFVLLLCAGDLHARSEEKKVKAIELRGLRLLGKFEVLAGVRMSRAEDGIIIDMAGLRKALRTAPYIKDYKVVEEKGGLRIIITEREPSFVVMQRRGSTTVPFELGERLEILSTGRLHGARVPHVLVEGEWIRGGRATARLARLLASIREIRSECPSLYGEIAEIDAQRLPRIYLYLRGRKTRFSLETGRGGMRAICSLCGYLDAAGRAPEIVELFGDRAVVK